VGNTQGAGGFGVGKAGDPATATARAIRNAKKSIIVVDRFKKTALYHSTEGARDRHELDGFVVVFCAKL